MNKQQQQQVSKPAKPVSPKAKKPEAAKVVGINDKPAEAAKAAGKPIGDATQSAQVSKARKSPTKPAPAPSAPTIPAQAAQASKPKGKAATPTTAKPAEVQKPAAPSVQRHTSIFNAIKAYGLPRPNLSHHIKNRRIDVEGKVLQKVYFLNRSPEEQVRLKDAMKKAGAGGFAIPDKSGGLWKFIPVKGQVLSHAPVDPGSYQSDIVRAWFALVIGSLA